MYEQVEKSKENKSQSVENKFSQKQSGGGSTFQFVNNRPEAIVQRKLQEMTNNSSQSQREFYLQSNTNLQGVLQRRIQVKGGALYKNQAELPISMQTTPDLITKANADGTHLVRKTTDLTKRVNDQESEILSPNRHLIGEIHTQSKFTKAVANWGWGADKMAESYQTSTDVTDDITVENKNLRKTGPFTASPYYHVKELENLHPYIIQSLSMLRFRLEELKTNTKLMACWAQKVVLNIDKNNKKEDFKKGEVVLSNQRKAALEEWNGSIAPHFQSYKRACAERLLTERGNGNSSGALLHDMATAMSNVWDKMEKNIVVLSKKPYNIFDSWIEKYKNLNTREANFTNFITKAIDVWADELVKMTKAEAQTIAGDTQHDVAIETGWDNAKNATESKNAVKSIGSMREIFMEHNINTNLNKPGIVQIGAAHVNNLIGKINDGKYHNSYDEFVTDTKTKT